MKTIAYFFTFVLSGMTLILTGCTQNSEFSLLNGEKKHLSDYSKDLVIINFWAEWCAPCLEEVPALNQLHHESTELNVAVIGVSYDQLESAKLREVVQKWDIQYPVMATEPVPILPFGLPETLPTNYLLRPDGEIVAKLIGKQDLESLKRAIEAAKQK